MTVQDLITSLSLTPYHLSDPLRVVTGGYCGDLLSWVMGRAPAGCAWLTIMSNGNVAAVAALTDVSCVLLTEGVQPDKDLLSKTSSHGINLLGSAKGTYELAASLSDALKDAT